MATNFKVGDIVWAKMKGFQAWPARVIQPKPEVKRPSQKKQQQFVLFFGSENYAWVSEESIHPFAEFKDKFTLTHRVPKGFREALESVDDYVKSQPELPAKTSELPSIDDELAAMFPDEKHEYAREPLSGKKKSSEERTKIKERKDSIGNNKSSDKIHKEKKEKPKEPVERERRMSRKSSTDKNDKVEKPKEPVERERRMLRKSSTDKNDKVENKAEKKTVKRSSSPSGLKSSKKAKLLVKITGSPARSPISTSPIPRKTLAEVDKGSESAVKKSSKNSPPPSPAADRERTLPFWAQKTVAETPPADDSQNDFSDQEDFQTPTRMLVDNAINAIGQQDNSATSPEVPSPKSSPPGFTTSPQQLSSSNSTNTSTLSDTSTAIRLETVPPKKDIIPTPMKIGYLGLGIMGQGMVMNLLKSGHEVTVWNRTSHKCRDFVKIGALKGNSPSEVVQSCDITFSCVADPQAVRDLVFGNSGVVQAIRHGKSFVDMSTVDVDTCTDIYEAVTARGGRFLEAPVVGSRQPALEGQLVILAAGDKSLYDDCYSCFEAMGKKAFFLGDVGNGARMKLIANMISGVMIAGLAEGMALAERVGIKQEDLLDVMSLADMDSSLLKGKGQAILIDDFDPNCPLQHQQKDLRLAINLGDTVDQPLPVTAAANELYKKAKAIGYGENDVSAVYKVTYL